MDVIKTQQAIKDILININILESFIWNIDFCRRNWSFFDHDKIISQIVKIRLINKFVEELITEKTYPVRLRWFVKKTFGLWLVSFALMAATAALLFSTYVQGQRDAVFTPLVPLLLVLLYIASILLQWLNFQYSLEADYFLVRQGIFAKKENHWPYGVIQNVLIKRSLLDRVFQMATLIVENASQSGLDLNYYKDQRNGRHIIGVWSNQIIIPGLSINDAESLKVVLLQKSQEKMIAEKQGGGL